MSFIQNQKVGKKYCSKTARNHHHTTSGGGGGGGRVVVRMQIK
jgi:hypothetical protein